MTHGVGVLLFSSAAGYWVLTLAAKEKAQMKKLGQVLGLIIIGVSLAGVACKIYYRTVCPKGMSGYPFASRCPYGVKEAPPAPAAPPGN